MMVMVANVMVVMMMVVTDHVRAGNSRNRDCGKNDESDQVAH